MNTFRLLAVVAGCCLLISSVARAADPSPFVMGKQFSGEMVMTSRDGMSMTNKVFMDNGKVRTESSAQGMQMIAIIRPDLQKMFTVMPAQKMVMEMPYDAAKMKQQLPPMTSDEGKYELIGPDTVDGVACTKYKITNNEGKVFFMWVDTSKQVPVKMAAADGTFSAVFKNFKTGPQDASLFEAPAGYQVMTMPKMPGGLPPGMPGGKPPGGEE